MVRYFSWLYKRVCILVASLLVSEPNFPLFRVECPICSPHLEYGSIGIESFGGTVTLHRTGDVFKVLLLKTSEVGAGIIRITDEIGKCSTRGNCGLLPSGTHFKLRQSHVHNLD